MLARSRFQQYRLDVAHAEINVAVLARDRRRLVDGDVVVGHVRQTHEVIRRDVVRDPTLGGDAAIIP